MSDTLAPTRRVAMAALAAAAGLGFGLAARAAQTGEHKMTDAGLAAHAHDWDWLVGKWNVTHRRLKGRLEGSTTWQEFNGTCDMRPTLGGFGNVDDNVLELPEGTYRAVGIRAFDPATWRWVIWWLDARTPTAIEPPVYGAFKDGIGTFMGDDTFKGKPIKVRFQWSEITANSALWQQAFSPDGGATWETNWMMRFTRAAA